MTNGAYKKDAFEKALRENMNAVCNAIQKVAR